MQILNIEIIQYLSAQQSFVMISDETGRWFTRDESRLSFHYQQALNIDKYKTPKPLMWSLRQMMILIISLRTPNYSKISLKKMTLLK